MVTYKGEDATDYCYYCRGIGVVIETRDEAELIKFRVGLQPIYSLFWSCYG